MRDIQNEEDKRNVALDKVGVRGVKYPVTVMDKVNKTQNTNAVVDLYVNLPHNFKGTHMSRFTQIFHKYHDNISLSHFIDMLLEIKEKLSAQKSYGKISFPYYIEKKAPVSGNEGILEYQCYYEAEVFENKHGKIESNFYVGISVPIQTLCPCSKAISEYGAHNQRGTVKIKLLYKDFFWLEDIINLVENCASTPLYSVLKRVDEKYVTEHAYDNPKFVEDVVREVYIELKKKKFKWFSVECETEESIHSHNAYAFAEFSDKKEN